MQVDLLKYEKELYNEGYKLIAGCDEVGRGPLVGPVVVAAVILPVNYVLEGLTDSKKLSEKKRNLFYDRIINDAISYSIVQISPKKIDKINIYQASKLGMKKAIKKLHVKPDYILTDAMPLELDNSLSIIKGDAKSITIAAASVLAKVYRDKLMEKLDKKYPEYGFKNHKGYPTKKHIEAIRKYGVLKNYRFTFKPVNECSRRENE